jgi:cysteine desulfurase
MGQATRHYLDHASTSPIRPEALQAMTEALTGRLAPFADPGRVHTEGRLARGVLEEARAEIARFLHVEPRRVVLTSSGSEAINTAVWSAARRKPGGVVVAAGVEHSAVREASALAAEVVEAPVDHEARIDLSALAELLDALLANGREVALVHCQLANHEVGTIQPAAEAVAICHARQIACHVDACAAGALLHAELARLDADYVSLSGHKLGGPPGIGVLALGRGIRLAPLVVGGDQERGRRAGFENLPAAVGLAAATRVLAAPERRAEEVEHARRLIARIIDLATQVPGVRLLGPKAPDDRLATIACFAVDDVEAEGVVLGLDQAGVAVHSGSACASEALAPSPVLAAMGEHAERSLRVSVGWSTTLADVDAFAEAFPQVVAKLRALRA